MIQSHIFITQTYVQQKKLAQYIAYTFEKHGIKGFDSLDAAVDSERLEKHYESMKHKRLVLEVDISTKKDYREIMPSLYTHFHTKTLLFLGDISTYSLELQEGMLRLLEEPPENLIIILSSHTSQELLPTIQSRSSVHTLKTEQIFTILDTDISEKVKKRLPSPAETAKEIISNSFHYGVIKDISKLEREEINMWLWMVSMYLTQILKQQPDIRIAKAVEKIVKSIQLNNANVLKKFVFSSLGL
jgi:DNA polymerase III delta prime subunit